MNMVRNFQTNDVTTLIATTVHGEFDTVYSDKGAFMGTSVHHIPGNMAGSV